MATHTWLGSLRLTDSHSSSQASPRPPLKRVRKAAPKRLPKPRQELYRARRPHVHAGRRQRHRRGALLWRQDLCTITMSA